MLDLGQHPHRRFNPLRGEWVIVSPHRNNRPWQGTVDVPGSDDRPAYDPACYLCPGNARADGSRNLQYSSTFAFDNDFPALVPLTPSPGAADDLLIAQSEGGICRVLCFSPRHDLTLARMDRPGIRAVVDAWSEEYSALAARPGLAYATIFENRGAAMGASNPHPHCQIWATEHVPNEPSREIELLASYHARKGSCLLCDYVAIESSTGERIVCANDAFVALVPFWAAWPFETLLVSRRHVGTLPSLRDDERDAMASILRELTIRYDNVFEAPFPYSMGFHQQPLEGGSLEAAHLHAHFYPPLVRSAAIRKFMVGFELLGSPQRDFTPEDAARRLQATPPVHYADRSKASAAR